MCRRHWLTLFGSNSPVEGVVGENECEDQYFLSVDAATEKNAWALAYRPVDRQFPSKRSVPLPREASSCLRWWLERNGRKMFILSPVKVQKITTTLRRRVETSSTINSLFLNSFGGQFSGECFGKVISQISRQFCGDRLTLSPRVFRKLKATYFIEYIMKNESNENRRQSLISRYAFLEGHSSETLLSHYFIKDSLSEQQDIMEVVEMANTACFVEADPESGESAGEETLTDVAQCHDEASHDHAAGPDDQLQVGSRVSAIAQLFVLADNRWLCTNRVWRFRSRGIMNAARAHWRRR